MILLINIPLLMVLFESFGVSLGILEPIWGNFGMFWRILEGFQLLFWVPEYFCPFLGCKMEWKWKHDSKWGVMGKR